MPATSKARGRANSLALLGALLVTWTTGPARGGQRIFEGAARAVMDLAR